MRYDYLVVGSGASGLTTAVILAGEGHRVALIEQHSQLAPLLRGFRRQGIYFDTGFHYTGGLGRGEPLDLFFRYLGLSGRLQTTPFDCAGFDVVRRPGRADFAFPVGEAALRQRLRQAFPQEAAAIDGYLQGVNRACAQLPYLDLDAEFSPGGLDGPSLAEELGRLTGDRELRRLLGVHGLLYGVNAEEVPFALHAAVAGPYYRSVHGLAGGGLSLVEAFEARLAELGVDLFCGREADAILFSAAGVLQGVRLADGEVLEGAACVVGMHPARLPSMVPEGVFRPVYRKRLAALEDSSSALILYAVCERLPELLRGRNLFLLDAEEGEPTVYLTATESAADGRAGMIAISPLGFEETAEWAGSSFGRRPAAYEAFKRRQAERLLGRIRPHCPELTGAIEVVETATPLTLRDYLKTPSGALYGVKHKVGQYNPMPQTRAENLYLTGQAVAAPGVLGAVLAGFLTCGTILGHERLRNKVKACR